ncbi:MAG: site-2 protease family protein [Armatimonadota bacterium]|nr:site-2 protease family protein [Armatimonadota bacterium]
MRGSLRVGVIGGIPVGVNYTWFFAIALIAWSLAGSYYPQRAPGFDENTYWIMGVTSALLLFAAVLVHEFGHALTARQFGIETKQIVLFLFGGVAQIADEPPTPRAEFLVAAAGPATSLGLAAACRLLEALLGGRPLGEIVHYLAIVNLLLAVFNLIPGFPLDGGRILRAALWARTGSLPRATRAAARTGQLVAMLFIGAGLVYVFRGTIVTGIWLVLIGWFLDTGAQSSYQQVVVRHGLGETTVGEIMSRTLHTVEPGVSVERAIAEYFLPHKHGGFPVVFGDHLIGIVTLQDVTAVPTEQRGSVTVRDVMTPRDHLRTVSVRDTAYDAFAMMARDNIGRLLVLDDDGNLAGIVTRSDLLQVLRLRAEVTG